LLHLHLALQKQNCLLMLRKGLAGATHARQVDWEWTSALLLLGYLLLKQLLLLLLLVFGLQKLLLLLLLLELLLLGCSPRGRQLGRDRRAGCHPSGSSCGRHPPEWQAQSRLQQRCGRWHLQHCRRTAK